MLKDVRCGNCGEESMYDEEPEKAKGYLYCVVNCDHCDESTIVPIEPEATSKAIGDST